MCAYVCIHVRRLPHACLVPTQAKIEDISLGASETDICEPQLGTEPLSFTRAATFFLITEPCGAFFKGQSSENQWTTLNLFQLNTGLLIKRCTHTHTHTNMHIHMHILWPLPEEKVN